MRYSLALAFTAIVLSVSCDKPKPPAASGDSGSAALDCIDRAADSVALGAWDGKNLYVKELDLKSSFDLARLHYERDAAEDRLIRDLVVSQQLGQDPATHAPIKQSDIDAYYAKNKASFPPNMPEASLTPLIRDHLLDIRRQTARADLILANPGKLKVNHPFQTCGSPVAWPKDDYSLPVGKKAKEEIDIVFYSAADCPECRAIWPLIAPLISAKNVSFKHLTMTANTQDPTHEGARAVYCASQSGPERTLEYLNSTYKASLHYLATGESLNGYLKTALLAQLQFPAKEFEACMKAKATNDFLDGLVRTNAQLGNLRSPILFINGHIQLLGGEDLASRVRDLLEIVARH